jgi:molybdopterin converting factor small subunit
MPEVLLRAPLSELCGGRSHAAAGTTVVEALAALERAHPPLRGWILDEQGRIREHIQIFVNGTHGEDTTAIGETDRIHVLPAITGG